jgi:hypothetical protein
VERLADELENLERLTLDAEPNLDELRAKIGVALTVAPILDTVPPPRGT